MLVKSLLAFEKDPSAPFPIEILNHAISYLFTESVIRGLGGKDGKSSLIDFEDLPADSLTRNFLFTISDVLNLLDLGKIPLSIIDRTMTMLGKVILSGRPLDKMGLGILEKLCLIVLNDFEKIVVFQANDVAACDSTRRKTMQAMGRHLEFFAKLQPVSN